MSWIPVIAFLSCAATASSAELRIKVQSADVKIGQTVGIEIEGEVDPSESVSWFAKPAIGRFIVGKDPKSVEFLPEGPGDKVTIVCRVIDLKTRTAREPYIEISLQPAAQTASPASRPAQDSKATPPQTAPAPQTPSVPAENDITLMGFVAAGYMGDAESGGVVLNAGSTEQPHSAPTCIKLTYRPGAAGWAAIGWQYVTEGTMNWGDQPGQDLNGQGFLSLRVWARGVASPEGVMPVVQFKSGGNTRPAAQYKASYMVTDTFRPLTAQFREYCLSLSGQALTNTTSPFTIVLTRAGNPNGASVYLDDIHFSKQACKP